MSESVLGHPLTLERIGLQEPLPSSESYLGLIYLFRQCTPGNASVNAEIEIFESSGVNAAHSEMTSRPITEPLTG